MRYICYRTRRERSRTRRGADVENEVVSSNGSKSDTLRSPGGVVERPEESADEPKEVRRTGRSTQRGAVEQEESAVKLSENLVFRNKSLIL